MWRSKKQELVHWANTKDEFHGMELGICRLMWLNDKWGSNNNNNNSFNKESIKKMINGTHKLETILWQQGYNQPSLPPNIARPNQACQNYHHVIEEENHNGLITMFVTSNYN